MSLVFVSGLRHATAKPFTRLVPFLASLALLAPPASAQAAAPVASVAPADGNTLELDKLVVSSTTQSLSAAQALRTQSIAVKDFASSDELGTFPDTNVAEALRRVPGVSLEANRGEGRFVTVRGAASSLNSYSLGGISLPTIENNRAVPLDVYATDLFERIEVSKALTPDQEGASLGGHVELVPKSVFDTGRTLSVEGGLGGHRYNDDLAWKISALYGDLFLDGKLGLMLGFSSASTPRAVRNVNTENWAATTVAGQAAFAPARVTLEERDFYRERTNLALQAEWRPNADLRVNYKLFGTGFDLFEHQGYSTHQFNGATQPGAVVDGNHGSLNLNNHRIDKSYTYVFNKQRTVTTQLGVENTWDRHWLSGAGSFSRTKETTPITESLNLRSGNVFRSLYTLGRPSPDLIADGGADRRDGSLFAYFNNDDRFIDRLDRESSTRLDYRFQAAEATRFQVGAKTRIHSKYQRTVRSFFTAYTGPTPLNLTPASIGTLDGPGPNYRGYDFGAAFDYEKTLALLRQKQFFTPNAAQTYNENLRARWQVDEDIHAAYAQGQTKVGEWNVLGGVRWEQTSTTAEFYEDLGVGALDDPARYRLVSRDRRYTNTLPGLHVFRQIGSRWQVRGAATASFARPDFASLAGTRTINRGNLTISEGNPNLAAVESANLDFSADYSLGESGGFSASLFYKEVDDFVYTQLSTEVLEGSTYTVSRPANASNGHLLGAELAFFYSFNRLPGLLRGLGVSGNVTAVDSEVTVPTRPGEKFRLFEQSKLGYNASLSYTTRRWDTRLAFNFQGGALIGLASPGLDRYREDRVLVDLTVQYRLNARFSFVAEVLNLTDSPNRTYAGNRSRPVVNEIYGQAALLSVRVRL